MLLSEEVKKLLSFYESDNPGVKKNLATLLMSGKLGGTGKIIIYPVDQGFEHGPITFVKNQAAFDPHYHYQLAIDAGLSAYAAPLGMIEAGANTYAGMIPTILKVNSSNRLYKGQKGPDQAITSCVKDALRLGCVGIGFTIYPGSDQSLEMFEEIRELAAQAKEAGLIVIIWSYIRGNVSKQGETALDTIAYGAHMSCLLGAHIVKVKLPTAFIEAEEFKTHYTNAGIDLVDQPNRVKEIVKSCFDGRRIIIFSGGESRSNDHVIQDAKDIKAGGGHGFIIGRNTFQRPREDALQLLDGLIKVFKN